MSCVMCIPVHESQESVINHIENIRKYAPSCSAVVLHISGDSPDSFFSYIENECLKKYDGYVYIHPKRYKTHKSGEAGNVTGLTTVWCDCFRQISQKIKFDHFIMLTSNELFVRRGLEEGIKNFSCQYPVVNPPWISNRVRNLAERGQKNIWEESLKKVGCVWPEFGVCEGSFFHYEVFKTCADIILDILNKEGIETDRIAHQEYIFPTIIFNKYPELYNSIIPETFVHGPKDYNPYAPIIPEKEILDVKNGKYKYRYVVKRVPRDINHPTRRYINDLNAKDVFDMPSDFYSHPTIS